MKDSIIIFGIHAVESILKKHPHRVIALHILQERHDQKIQSLHDLAVQASVRIRMQSRATLDQLTHDALHQGVVAECVPAKPLSENDLEKLLTDEIQSPAFLLVLDGIQDPHNLGACLRTADAAGVHAVIAPRDKSVGITPTVSKVACGAAETVPFVQVTNLARTLEHLKEKNIWIYGAAGEAKNSFYHANFKVPVAIVLGAEGTGLRRLTRDTCDELFNIPMFGAVSSLNVSVATGVFLFEAVRQRK